MSRYSGRCVGGGWYAVIQKFQSYYSGLVFPKLGNWEVMSGGGSNEYRKMSCYGYLWILEIWCRLSIGLIIKLVSHPKVIECQGNSEHNFPDILLFIYSGQIVLSGSDATSGAVCFCCWWSRFGCEWLTCIYLDGSDVVCRRQLLIAASVLWSRAENEDEIIYWFNQEHLSSIVTPYLHTWMNGATKESINESIFSPIHISLAASSSRQNYAA